MIKQFNVVVDDHHWPNLRIKIGEMETESLYDTAYSNFEVRVQNALRVAVRDVVANRGKPEAVPHPIPPKKKRGRK